jgi:ABC-type nitrate/sulfonate/bicarbonate transport system substrate-binding protein
MEYMIPGQAKIVAFTYVDSPQTELFTFLVPINSNLTGLKDLKGKKVATTTSPGMASTIKLVLERYFNPNQVEIITLPSSEHLIALESGSVDAIYTSEPTIASGISSGKFKELDPDFARSKYFVNPYYSSSIVLSREMIKEKPSVTERFIKALSLAAEYQDNNPDESRKILSVYTGTPPEISSLMKINKAMTYQAIDKAKLQKEIDLLSNSSLINGPVNASNVLFGHR